MACIHVLIADDHPVFRSGVANLLGREPEIVLVGEASDGANALNLVRELKPDVLLLDMEMPGLKGYEVIRQIKQEGLPVAILVLSAYDDQEYIQEVLALGVSGYLVKEEAPEAIIEAVKRVAEGERGWVSRRIMAIMIARVAGWGRAGMLNPHGLTERELQVLKGVVNSKTNGEIALDLKISVKTVEKHMVAVFDKLGVTSRVEAAVQAVREGIF